MRYELPEPKIDWEWTEKISQAIFLASDREGRLNIIKHTPLDTEYTRDLDAEIAWCKEHLDDPQVPVSADLVQHEGVRATLLAGCIPMEEAKGMES